MMKYLLYGSNYGKLVLLIGGLAGFPMIMLPFYPSEMRFAPAFLIPMILSFAIGIIICAGTYRKKETVFEWRSSFRQGSMPVLFVWCYSFIIFAIPFMVSMNLNLIHALFESVSNLTATGLTVVNGSGMPRIFQFYRSFMHFCGGLGFVLMMVVVIHDKQSMSLYSAEGHLDKHYLPNLRKTSQSILTLSLIFVAAGTIMYRLFGVEALDAACLAMSTISTASVLTHAGSFGVYGSLPVELITIALMLLGATNFTVLLMLRKGKVRQALRVSEMRFMIGLLAVFVSLATFSLRFSTGMSFGESFRNALFGVVSIFSTTGYSIMDYYTWPPFGLGLILLLVLIGGSSGSTAGGIKLSRVYFMIRSSWENVQKRLSPVREVIVSKYNTVRGKALIEEHLVVETFVFVACYVAILVIGTLLFTLTAGCSIFVAMYEFASVLGTVGVSDRLINAGSNTATLIVGMCGMILGRLEIFIVFVGISTCLRAVKMKFSRKASLRERKSRQSKTT